MPSDDDKIYEYVEDQETENRSLGPQEKENLDGNETTLLTQITIPPLMRYDVNRSAAIFKTSYTKSLAWRIWGVTRDQMPCCDQTTHCILILFEVLDDFASKKAAVLEILLSFG